jgi:hypothetical protein
MMAACAAGALASCSGAAAPGGGMLSSANVLPLARGQARAATLPSQLLFVPTENGTIDIYPLANPSQSGPVAQITGLTAFQDGMDVDKSGDLFVVNNGPSGNDDYVSEFAPPYTGSPKVLSTTWQSELFYPIGVAVDSKGTVYVSSCGAYCLETPAIFVYPAGATSPASRITSSDFNGLAGLTVDSKDNLYAVAWNDETFAADVFEIRAGSTTPKPLHLHGLDTGSGGNGVSLDSAGDIFVSATSSGSNYVLEYRPHAHNAFRVIDTMPFLDEPLQLQVGPDGNLYVPVNCASAPCVGVYAFKPKGKKAFESIGSSSGLTDTFGVATAPNLQLEGSKR